MLLSQINTQTLLKRYKAMACSRRREIHSASTVQTAVQPSSKRNIPACDALPNFNCLLRYAPDVFFIARPETAKNHQAQATTLRPNSGTRLALRRTGRAIPHCLPRYTSKPAQLTHNTSATKGSQNNVAGSNKLSCTTTCRYRRKIPRVFKVYAQYLWRELSTIPLTCR